MLQPQKKSFGEKIYPWLLVLLPVLNQYQVGPVDLDVIVMTIFFLCAVFFYRNIRISPVGRFVLVLVGYIFFITVANIAIGYKYSPVSDIIIRTGKYILYLLIVFFLGNECISYESLMKAYRVVAFAATIYIVIQTVAFYGAGITLPSKIGGSIKENEVSVGRLRAFYSEPAVMSYSLLPFIVCSLFGKPYRTAKRYHNGREIIRSDCIPSRGEIQSRRFRNGGKLRKTECIYLYLFFQLKRVDNRQEQRHEREE